MAPLDLFTAGAAGVGTLALALRGNMLKPEVKGWVSSRGASLIIMGLSAAMGVETLHVWIHGGVTPREAWLVSAMAATAVLMLVNLWAQRHDPGKNG